MFSTSKKELRFYDYFVDATRDSCKAAELLDDLIRNYTDVPQKVRAIEDVEHVCDQHVHKILEQLNKSFITPIDREDIYEIAKELDSVTDYIEATAHRFTMFNVTAMREPALRLSSLVVRCAHAVHELMQELHCMKTSKTMKDRIIEINTIEEEGDKVYRDAITDLFVNEKDAIEVIKWKAIYEHLEWTLDACEDVANIVTGVVMKHA